MSSNAPLLIVNADDYGLTEGVSRAILEGHQRGVVTSTSALALGSGWTKTASWLVDHPALGVGAHLAAVGEDPPLLSAREIPTLVDGRGRLCLSWRQFLPRAAAGRIDPSDLRREFAAQLATIEEVGITVTHVDTHQNLHLWPMVRSVVLELADRREIPAIRVTRSAARSVVGATVRRLSRRLETASDQAGLVYPAASTGLDEAGHLALPAMNSALDRLARSGAPSAELATHPGEAGDGALDRYAWSYQWSDELAALLAPSVREAIDASPFELGTFADLSDRTGRAGRPTA
jgi:predicted glycoside hydrolase/deacetylase ChbG (UPF0249 family)